MAAVKSRTNLAQRLDRVAPLLPNQERVARRRSEAF
jgi:hypothetical protein